jgi:hypothetical protein
MPLDGGNNLATLAQVPAGRRDRFFYTGMAVLVAAIVFAGFARTYFLKDLFGRPALPLLLHLHGILFTSWFALFLSQVTLVAAKRTDVHRRLGVVGAVLAAVMVVVGPIVAIHAASRGFATPGLPPPLVFLAVPLFDILVFAILVAAGLYYRRQSQTHKRLMLLATIAILPPAIARLPFAFILATGPLAFFGLADLVLLACILYDVIAHRRLHPAYVWGGLLIVVSQPLRLVVGSTGAWLAFAHWLTH